MDRIYYGIKVEHINGEVFYFGIGFSSLYDKTKCSFTNLYKNEELSKKDNMFCNFPLSWKNIQRTGYSSFESAKKELMTMKKYLIYKSEVVGDNHEYPKFSIVELNTYLFEIRAEKKSEVLGFFDKCPNIEISNEDEYIIKDSNEKIIKFDDFKKNRK